MRQSTTDSIKAALVCGFVLFAVILLTAAKVDAYGGDVGCLFIKCVKVIK